MAAVFTPAANLWSKIALLGLAALFAAGIGWWFLWPRSDYVRLIGWWIEQPVPFSHQHHVAGLGIDCRFCHASVEISAEAGMPSTDTCMTCHSQIWTNAALLAPVRDSLATNTPVSWNRVTDLPAYVYFNHAIHVAKGIGCVECHGRVDRMALTYKAKSLTMGFCLSCHRDPDPHLWPADKITDMAWHRDASTSSPAALHAFYHLGGRDLTDCSICHR